jgi:hypothetical protein
MKSIFKQLSAEATGKAGQKARKQKTPTRRRHLVRG